MWRLLEAVGNDNAQGEYYLPDVATGAIAEGARVVVIETDAAEVAGVNSRAELAAVEAGWQARRRQAAMDGGVTLIAPETVWFAWDTQLGRDVTIEPNVFFGRSEEHTSELQSLMRISYAVFCLKKKKT